MSSIIEDTDWSLVPLSGEAPAANTTIAVAAIALD